MAGLSSGKVCVFGAGGPVGAVAAESLRELYTLRLTDVRHIDEILAANKPQSSGAPLPARPDPPHEWRCVDVTDYGQVLEAATGVDALINVTVVRPDLAPAFAVNVLGAYNVMKAAVACGVKRVIHTGPRHTALQFEGDYSPDFGIPDDAPLHPGSDLYALTKFLGGEIVRIFAEEHDLEVITFLYCAFRPAADGRSGAPRGVHPFTIAWEDTGEPFKSALQADRMPNNYEVFDICMPAPHGKWGTDKPKRLLGWEAKHTFEGLYRRTPEVDT